jgi:hypothetical protein
MKEESQRMRRISSAGSGNTALSPSLTHVELSRDNILTSILGVTDEGRTAQMQEVDGTEEVFRDLLADLARHLIDVKYKASMEDGLSQQLQQQLEAKQTELDDLQASANKLRNEYQRRSEQSKREGEDKIAFLVQQLRQAENRHNVFNGNSTNVSMTSISRSVPDQPQLSVSRPTTAAGTAPQTPIHRFSDTVLARVSHDFVSSSPAATGPAESSFRHLSLRKDAASVESSTFIQQQQQEEILRRWQAEKDRREQLEKKNSELFRELRDLRAKSR